jgi:hypothetical protein
MNQQQSVNLADLVNNWPYYAYDISAKTDPNQYNELSVL